MRLSPIIAATLLFVDTFAVATKMDELNKVPQELLEAKIFVVDNAGIKKDVLDKLNAASGSPPEAEQSSEVDDRRRMHELNAAPQDPRGEEVPVMDKLNTDLLVEAIAEGRGHRVTLQRTLPGTNGKNAFDADVVAPVNTKNNAKDIVHHDGYRHLQGTLRCFDLERPNGEIDCLEENSPQSGLITAFVCPPNPSNLAECFACFIYAENTVEEIDENTVTCDSCSVCLLELDAIFSYDCANVVGGSCASRNCNDVCTNSGGSALPTPSPPTPSPNPAPSPGSGDASCFELDNGQLACPLDDVPAPGLITYLICPATAATLSQCPDCIILVEDSREDVDENSVACDSCTVCSSASSTIFFEYDCTNGFSGNCASGDCSGDCTNQGPTPFPTPFPTGSTQTTPLPTSPQTSFGSPPPPTSSGVPPAPVFPGGSPGGSPTAPSTPTEEGGLFGGFGQPTTNAASMEKGGFHAIGGLAMLGLAAMLL